MHVRCACDVAGRKRSPKQAATTSGATRGSWTSSERSPVTYPVFKGSFNLEK